MLPPGFNFIPHTHQCRFLIPAYDMQAELNLGYLAGKVRIYRGEIRHLKIQIMYVL